MSSSLLDRGYPGFQEKCSEDGIAPIDMSTICCIILGGGAGKRLDPLTKYRCKPAVFFGGRYRLIDVPVSNAVNSGCLKIYILTQFLSSSIHRHIMETYHLGEFSTGFIDVLSAETKPSQSKWFEGTADAVRHHLDSIMDTPADYFLILSGDQLYNIDFRKMVSFAKQSDADLVVASLPVSKSQASRMGIMKIDSERWITDFVEKPKGENVLNDLEIPFHKGHYLASMGIYLFKRDVMLSLLREDNGIDFGMHLIPEMVSRGNTAAFLYDGYWEDIGTIKTYYEANLALTKKEPQFEFYDESNPIYSTRNRLPGPKVFETEISHSLLCEGAVIEAERIVNSIIGPRSVIYEGTHIEDSYIMGNDFYQPPVQSTHFPPKLCISRNCVIKKAIIDKNVLLGEGVRLVNKNNISHYDGDNLYVRDGIIIVTKGAELPNGFEF